MPSIPRNGKMFILMPFLLWFLWFVSFFATFFFAPNPVLHVLLFFLLSIVTIPLILIGIFSAIRTRDIAWIIIGAIVIIMVLYICYSMGFKGQIFYIG